MKALWAVFLVGLIFSATVVSAEEVLRPIKQSELDLPSFSDYSVKVGFFEKAKNIDLNSHPKAALYKSRLGKGFLEDADFAGHYKIVTHGCGSSCQVNWIIDLRTGEVVDNITSSFGISYKLDSSLIIRGCDLTEYEQEPDVSESMLDACYSMQGGITLYKIEGNKIVEIRTIPTDKLYR